METCLKLYIIINCCAFFTLFIATLEDIANFSFVNPKVIYNNIKVNWFGAIFLAIIANISLPVIAIPYWIYKLCTVGRKD